MYVCADCLCVFDTPKHVTEQHGLDTPPYEEYEACPYCYAMGFVETFPCDDCGDDITGRYVELENGKRYCEECFTVRNLLD